jgi:hypothetical protein
MWIEGRKSQSRSGIGPGRISYHLPLSGMAAHLLDLPNSKAKS